MLVRELIAIDSPQANIHAYDDVCGVNIQLLIRTDVREDGFVDKKVLFALRIYHRSGVVCRLY
jgi:hypothetical protein